MILTNRLFERQPPSREAKSLYIFCEGIKREYQYFEYFREKDSRINLEVYKLNPEEDNSPLGLLKIAKKCILPSKDNPKPKFNFQPNDEVWIVLDSDPDRKNSRDKQINKVKKECEKQSKWFVTESNPCFEVWLFYHKNERYETFENDDMCTSWKQKVNNSIIGGFDSRRHPIFIEEAIVNSENNFNTSKSLRPLKGSTEMHSLAKSILSVMKSKIRAVKKNFI